MHVLLIGAGRYGNNLIGRKYAKGALAGMKLVGVVDPKIDQIKQSADYTLKGFPTYRSLTEVPKNIVKNCISDVAVIPQIIPEVFGQLIRSGAKKVILPKPVVTNQSDFDTIAQMSEAEKMKTLVSSNWHYSNVTKLLKTLIDKLTNGEYAEDISMPEDFKSFINKLESGYKIKNVEVEYNKKEEVLTIDPPLQELPHALQIVYSTGLTNLEKIKIVMKNYLQNKSRVNINIVDKDSKKSPMMLNSDLNMKERLQNKRERIVKIFLEKDGETAILKADYDADFNTDGTCKKKPSLMFESPTMSIKFELLEDNMNVMYKSMHEYMQGKENNSLTLEKFRPIAKRIFQTEEMWLNACKSNAV